MSDAMEMFLVKQGLENIAKRNNYDYDKMMADANSATAGLTTATVEEMEIIKKLFKLTIEIKETISKWVELQERKS